jgi:hypothetical protein
MLRIGCMCCQDSPHNDMLSNPVYTVCRCEESGVIMRQVRASIWQEPPVRTSTGSRIIMRRATAASGMVLEHCWTTCTHA